MLQVYAQIADTPRKGWRSEGEARGTRTRPSLEGNGRHRMQDIKPVDASVSDFAWLGGLVGARLVEANRGAGHHETSSHAILIGLERKRTSDLGGFERSLGR